MSSECGYHHTTTTTTTTTEGKNNHNDDDNNNNNNKNNHNDDDDNNNNNNTLTPQKTGCARNCTYLQHPTKLDLPKNEWPRDLQMDGVHIFQLAAGRPGEAFGTL